MEIRKKTNPLRQKPAMLALVLGVGLAAAGLIAFPSDAAAGATEGVYTCINILIPSSFPFLVLASFCVHSGVSVWLGKLLRPVIRLLFHLPGCCGATIFMSLAGGYPVGTRGIVTLYQQGSITRKQANRMLCFCVNAGPSFTISVIGSCLYDNPLFGLLLFGALTAASLLLGMALGLWSRIIGRNKAGEVPEATASAEKEPQPLSWGDALVVSAWDSAKGMTGACCFVILFSAFLAILHACGLVPFLSGLLFRLGISTPTATASFPLLWEIIGGSVEAAATGASLLLVAFAVGFGGLCVHFQILAAASPIGPSRLRFTLARALHGLLSAGLLALLLRWVSFAPSGPFTSVFHNTSAMLQGGLSAVHANSVRAVAAAVTLLALCLVLLLCHIKRKGASHKIG